MTLLMELSASLLAIASANPSVTSLMTSLFTGTSFTDHNNGNFQPCQAHRAFQHSLTCFIGIARQGGVEGRRRG